MRPGARLRTRCWIDPYSSSGLARMLNLSHDSTRRPRRTKTCAGRWRRPHRGRNEAGVIAAGAADGFSRPSAVQLVERVARQLADTAGAFEPGKRRVAHVRRVPWNTGHRLLRD